MIIKDSRNDDLYVIYAKSPAKWGERADTIFNNNCRKGFWPDGVSGRNFGEAMALIHSEVSEAYEGFLSYDVDSKLNAFTNFKVEVADIVIRLLDLIAAYKLPIDWFLNEGKKYHGYNLKVYKPASMSEDLMVINVLISKCLEANRKPEIVDVVGYRLREDELGLMLCFMFILSFMEKYDIGDDVVLEKMAYNTNREYMHGKKY